MTVMRLVDRKKEETMVRRPNRRAGRRLPKQGNRRSASPWREMHDRYGLLLRAFFRRFFKPIRLSAWQENRLKELNETGHVIYVMERASLLHYLFLNYTCLRLQLPLASYGNGIASFVFFQPVDKVLRALWARIRRRSAGEGGSSVPGSGRTPDGPEGHRSMVLFLRRYQRFGKRRYTEAKEFIEDLVQFQAECRRPVYLVPMGILWGKGPDKVKKGIFDVLLGRKDAPGRLRQILVLFRYSRNSLVTMGQEMNLQAYTTENIHLEHDLLLKKIRWNLHRELDLARSRLQARHVIYVMERASLLYYLFLNYTLLRLQLPLATYGNGIPSFVLFQPAGKVLRALWTRVRKRSEGEGGSPAPQAGENPDGPAGHRSMVLFLRRYQRFGKRRYTEAKEFLEDLVQFQAGCRRPVYLVPMGILWGKGPEKVQKGFIDVLLGRKDAPGRLRQILVLIRYSRHSMVTMGQVMNLQAYTKENTHLEHDLLLKKIRWNLHRELDLAKKQITGPSLKPRKYIIESILSSRTLRDQAREIARVEGKSFEKIMKRAEKYADEIAADYRITYIEFLSLLLSWVWNNIYSGFSVDMKGLERVKAAVRKGSVILMPSHKSHVDYLVLSYLFYQNDLPPPHIAAGVNLSFWPLGHIFRRAGAFFIRRTIRGQKLYATVFSTYLRNLLREGYVQEFFLEGTRSRTGKLLQPRLGML